MICSRPPRCRLAQAPRGRAVKGVLCGCQAVILRIIKFRRTQLQSYPQGALQADWHVRLKFMPCTEKAVQTWVWAPRRNGVRLKHQAGAILCAFLAFHALWPYAGAIYHFPLKCKMLAEVRLPTRGEIQQFTDCSGRACLGSGNKLHTKALFWPIRTNLQVPGQQCVFRACRPGMPGTCGH